jgi:selenocysteine-specific elongation factor
MRVIGTAGHVDHGKSTLVAALTGIHPDRLKEEREREMTIDLGFAWLTLPGSGELVGVVDVPGHRDFIENMLAGVGGIDAALFVVAADEGVMPQTREHLAILDILRVPAGLVVLTKADLVDSDWLEMVRQDVRQVLGGTVLQDAVILPVSARSGTGLEELRTALADLLGECPPRLDLQRPRLPVDRVFTIAGFGTVVTGTLLDGQFSLGDEVQVLPGELRGRVRGLQSYKHQVPRAEQGSRVAVNISGVDVSQVQRGNVIALPGKYIPTRRMDVFFRLLPDAGAGLKHGTEVKLYLGAAEAQARVRLLGFASPDAVRRELVLPGEEAWLQLELGQPLVAVRGDRYILRRPSPGETLGGGEVVDPHPARRSNRFDAGILDGLHALRKGSPGEVLLQAWMPLGAVTLSEGIARAHLSPGDGQAALEETTASGQLLLLEPGALFPRSEALALPAVLWRALTRQAQEELDRYHRQNPLRRGMPREELKSRLRLPARVYPAALRMWTTQGELVENAGLVALPEHTIRFTPPQQAKVERLLLAFKAAPYAPPGVKECQAQVGEESYAALVELGELVPVSEEVVFRAADYAHLLEAVRAHFRCEPTLTVAQFRDRFGSSRRYALAFLEHLDALGVTVREGDKRRLK